MGFNPREVIPGLPQEAQRELFQIQLELQRALQQLGVGTRVRELLSADVFASVYDRVRVAVPSTGLTVILPDPKGAARDAWVEVLTESTAGTLTVESVNGQVNAAANVTSTALGCLRFVSNGVDGWFSTGLSGGGGGDGLGPDGDKGDVTVGGTGTTLTIDADAVTNAKLANMPASSIKLNNTGGAADPIDGTVAQALALLGAFSLLNLQVFTASGTYTPTTGMKHCLVITTGSGGGGGGADATAATTPGDAAAGAGGGAGGTCIEAFSAATIGASQAVTIGTAGTAGSATNGTAGGAGGNSTFGALHTANGGAGGAGSGVVTTNGNTATGGLGGTPTGGLLNIEGGDGGDGAAITNDDATAANEFVLAMGGMGGASFWGGGGREARHAAGGNFAVANNEAGVAGRAFGSGGSGGTCLNSTTGAAGGAGRAGVCVVIEFA